MIEISTDKIAQVILMAREGSRAEGELRGFLETLNDDEQASLTAVMWIGRGAYEAEELDRAKSVAMAEKTTPTADYLLGVPHLSENLENGLEALGMDVSEIEDSIL